MSEAIVVALISAAVTFAGVVISAIATNSKTQHTINEKQAVTETKIDELTREVREHNNFARRMPVVEEQIKTIYHIIDDLERKVEK